MNSYINQISNNILLMGAQYIKLHINCEMELLHASQKETLETNLSCTEIYSKIPKLKQGLGFTLILEELDCALHNQFP